MPDQGMPAEPTQQSRQVLQSHIALLGLLQLTNARGSMGTHMVCTLS